MNFENINSVYFIGVGGIGMSALARYFKKLGKNVAGYDRVETNLTNALQNEDIDIHFSDDISLIPKIYKTTNQTLVVFTPAIPQQHKELNFFMENSFTIMKRSEVLGIIIKDKQGIAIAGTHGKTTVSSITAHIFNNSQYGCNAFLGGIANNVNSNLILNNNSNYFVVEADEFDRSFLQLSPVSAIITSIDADHLDIYGNRENLVKSFNDFVKQIASGGILLINKAVENDIIKRENLNIFTYSLHENADFSVKSFSIEHGKYIVDFQTPFGVIDNVKIGIPGLLNIENACAAIAIALLENIDIDTIKKSVSEFKGVKRRFEYKILTNKLVYIDDYAHHPNELRACISSVKKLFPGKKITGIFQPHLYSRTKDFADDFADSLSLLDELILLDIYPARELPVAEITSKLIFDKIKIKNKFLITKGKLLHFINNKKFEVVLTLGAGDIDRLVKPIKELLSK